jgi:hypothetical protein
LKIKCHGTKIKWINQTKTKKKILRKKEWYMQDQWDIIKKEKLQIIGIEEEIQGKGIENIFNK